MKDFFPVKNMLIGEMCWITFLLPEIHNILPLNELVSTKKTMTGIWIKCIMNGFETENHYWINDGSCYAKCYKTGFEQ